jgi:hypothetical protein
MKRVLFAAALLVLLALPARAQTIPGLILILPTSTMDFQPSADHNATKLDGSAVVASYRVDYYLLDASGNIPANAVPAFSTNLGKPTPVNNIIVVPNAFGAIVSDTAYRVKVVAVGPDGAGVSPASVPFGKSAAKVPAAPPAPRIGQ